MWLLERSGGASARPALYACCGTDDALYEQNRRFAAAAGAHGVALTTDFGPGEHDWAYWDSKIQDVLDWLPRPGPARPA